MSIQSQFLRFGIVGTIGFITDAGVLALLLSDGVSHYFSRMISFPIAVIVTWFLNRTWTFSGTGKAQAGRQVIRYFIIQSIGALTNFLIYLGVLSVISSTVPNAVLALAIGSAAGLIMNYIGSKQFVFQSPK